MEVNTRQIAEFIETKQYKKALKAADLNLKKHPKHAETLCLKSLTLRYVGRKEESYDLVKEGLKYGLKSYVCWHVYGLMHRHDKDYAQAISCYRNALKFEPHNVQILRDLALLQLHERDLSGAVETRKRLCETAKTSNINLIGYAVTEHMAGNPTKAFEILDDKSKIIDDFSRVDRSEMQLYKAMLLEQSGKWKDVLQLLHDKEPHIVDKMKLKETKARILMYCGKLTEAHALYKELYARNPENHVYILCLVATDVRFREFWPPVAAPALTPKDAAGADESCSTTAGEDASTSSPSQSDLNSEDSAKLKDGKDLCSKEGGGDKNKKEEKPTGAVEGAGSSSCCSGGVCSASGPKTGTTAAASSSSPSIADEIDWASIKYGASPHSNAQAFPPEFHPAGAPVFGWPASADRNSFLQKAQYKRIGKRMVKQKKPFLMYPLGGDIPVEKQKELLEFIGELRDTKKSESAERIALFFLNGTLFQEKLKKFLRPRLQKGLPSLFRLLKPFYFHDSVRWKLIEDALLEMLGPLEQQLAFEGEGADSTTPTSLLFLYQLLAEHYNIMGEFETALKYMEIAIKMAPTHPELYMMKGKILKDSGDLWTACEFYNEARELDLADRYLNTRAVKAMLRIDDCKRAQPTMILFSRDSAAANAPQEPGIEAATNLHDMQCLWYESEVARSYMRQQIFGRSLRYLKESISHFNDISDDQFDFHNYCLRKNGLTTYTSMLKMQDHLFSHKFYRRAVKDMLRLVMLLMDKKELEAAGPRGGSPATGAAAEGGADAPAQAAGAPAEQKELSAAEKKKLKHAAKRQGKKAEVEKEASKQLEAATVLPCTVSKSTDPNGTEFLRNMDLDKEATTLIQSLLRFSPQDPHTFSCAYHYYSRQKNHSRRCAKMLLDMCKLELRMERNFRQSSFEMMPRTSTTSAGASASSSSSTSGLNPLEAIPFLTRPTENHWLLSETLPCLAHFVNVYLLADKGGAEELQSEDIRKETLSMLGEILAIMTVSSSDVMTIPSIESAGDVAPAASSSSCSNSSGAGEADTKKAASSSSSPALPSSVSLPDVADAKKFVGEKFLKPVDSWKCTTMKEHDARFRIWKETGKDKKFLSDQLTSQLKPEASWGPFEHFQKFQGYLELELQTLGFVTPEAVTAFADKCKGLFTTSLKLMQQSIMDAAPTATAT
ncbi:unnamed protein product [Amoebophrya sp. A25]|nr:unnamed protein product [Amoebophrya sp. A25]|eukprot:GSA25T00004009001.1